MVLGGATRARSRSSSPDREACVEEPVSPFRSVASVAIAADTPYSSVAVVPPYNSFVDGPDVLDLGSVKTKDAPPPIEVAGAFTSPGLAADVWERSQGCWHVTHHLVAGLELDGQSIHATGNRSRVHLPCTSLRALQQLRALLHQPHAVELDVVCDAKSWGLSDTQSPCHRMLRVLLDQMGSSLTEDGRNEAWKLLASRTTTASPLDDLLSQIPCPCPSPAGSEDQDLEEASMCSENLLCPEVGMEAVDISICPLEGVKLPIDEPLAIAVCRLAAPTSLYMSKVPVRYAALVLCAETESLHLAREVGRALATTFMDEEFAGKIHTTPSTQPDAVLRAFDTFLSTLTIVPTVYVGPRGTSTDLPELLATQLQDSLVESLEKLICRVKGVEKRHEEAKIHHHIVREEYERSPPAERNRYVVEVNEKVDEKSWGVTHRLRQGLEVDFNSTHTAHLPRVSVAALAQARQIMDPNSVALDVPAPSVQAGMEAITGQLRRAGVAEAPVLDIAQSLMERIENGADPGRCRTKASDLGIKACRELVRAADGDEACHVWVMTCRQMAEARKLVGAFVRFRSPLGFRFEGSDAPVRFLMVIVGPPQAHEDLAGLADSLAGLLLDEDLMGDLASVNTVNNFLDAVDLRLDNLVVVPHARVHACGKVPPVAWQPELCLSKSSTTGLTTSTEHILQTKRSFGSQTTMWINARGSLKRRAKWFVAKAQKYSLPLVSGVMIALIWSNIDEKSYHDMAESPLWEGASLIGHDFSLHFLVNDIFMCFFFGLAIKEVTEALLPGGSLSPLKRAINPLMATVGGVVGPIAGYVICVLILHAVGTFDGEMCVKETGRRLGGSAATTGEKEACTLGMLLKGWGVPTATDISLAWMFALLIFGPGHPAINFLLLLAIVDDALGMIIIAVFYSDPAHPVEPLWLLLVLASMLLAALMRFLRVPRWQYYTFICGPVSWLGLIKAHVHPALALVAVVPFMPAMHATQRTKSSDRHLGACDLGPEEKRALEVAETMGVHPAFRRTVAMTSARLMSLYYADSAPLHVFEHTLKLPVDFGMFFFGLANAGVKLSQFGGITISVVVALIIGKTIGIAGFALLAKCMGFGLPNGVSVADLFAMSALGGVGLTVALFVANQAFVDPGLKGQAKMGAVISVAAAGFAWLLRAVFGSAPAPPQRNSIKIVTVTDPHDDTEKAQVQFESTGNGEGEVSDWIDDLVVGEIMQIMWAQRRYEARGMNIGTEQIERMATPTASSTSHRPSRLGSGLIRSSSGVWEPPPTTTSEAGVGRSSSKASNCSTPIFPFASPLSAFSRISSLKNGSAARIPPGELTLDSCMPTSSQPATPSVPQSVATDTTSNLSSKDENAIQAVPLVSEVPGKQNSW